MKALILAAGMGTRLRPMTDSKPKSMVEVNSKPILFQQIDSLLENGIEDIAIIVGYKAEYIKKAVEEKYENIKIIINDIYDKTNNMYSAYLAKDYFYNDEFLLMNADVFFDSSIIKELLNVKYENAIVIEEGAYNDENMKVTYINDRLSEINKGIPIEDAYGVSIDIYKFSQNGSKILFDHMEYYIENKKELNQWTEVAINDTLKLIEFIPCPLNGRWIEIDDHNDLKEAEKIFNGQ